VADLGTVLDEILEETHEPAEGSAFKVKIQDLLLKLRGERYTFTNKTDTFPTVANQDEYVPGVGSVPADIKEIDFMRITSSGRKTPIEKRTFEELRRAQWIGLRSSEPRIWAWYADQIHFWPTPSGVFTISIDYFSDSTLSDESGHEGEAFNPTTSADTFTNPFFRDAKHYLKWGVLVDWAMGRGDDEAMAMRARNEFLESKKALKRELVLKVVNGIQTPCYI